jgi:hypothetical protein
MKHGFGTIALLLALAGAAAAQDGGKLDWKGKGEDPIAPSLTDALRDARPIMLFFSAEGNQDCIALSAGAFSHPAVVEAASKISCIFVECGAKKNSALVSNLKITKVPAVHFLDGEGRPLGPVQPGDGPALAAAILRLIDLGAHRPPYTENIAQALKDAKTSGLPLLIYFYDDSAASLSMNRSLTDPELDPLRTRFQFSRTEMKKGSDLCVTLDVDRAPTVLVLDAARPRPQEHPIVKITVSRNPRELRRDLEEALAAFRSSGPPPPLTPPTSSASPPAPKEVLSDDEVDRKFIQARMNVALEARKQGNKAKAVEVLEDIIQSFPKHVLTKEARALLEELKKQP